MPPADSQFCRPAREVALAIITPVSEPVTVTPRLSLPEARRVPSETWKRSATALEALSGSTSRKVVASSAARSSLKSTEVGRSVMVISSSAPLMVMLSRPLSERLVLSMTE